MNQPRIESLDERALLTVAAPSELVTRDATTTSVTLAWKDNANNESGYRIEKSTADAGPWSVVTSLPANRVSATVLQGDRTAVRYRVVALGAGSATTNWSNWALSVMGGAANDSIKLTTRSTFVDVNIAGVKTSFTLGAYLTVGVFGRAGNDAIDTSPLGRAVRVEGADGNDTITTGAGNDYISGGNGNDSVIANNGNDSLYGDAGNDTLWGDEGTDTVSGGDGNDTLGGYLGSNNLLIGGAGADIFCQTTGAVNRLQDFVSGQDKKQF